jgi:hypothetical protein
MHPRLYCSSEEIHMSVKDEDEVQSRAGKVTRRSFLSQVGAAGVVVTTAPLVARAAQTVEPVANSVGGKEKV